MNNSTAKAIKIEEAYVMYEAGLEFLKKQKPREAIPYFQRALQIYPQLEEAREALEDTLEALSWNAWYFCSKCGKAVLPNSQYPFLDINGFCPRCGESIPTQKEILINVAEVGLKLFLFGIFPILVFIFCGLPNYQFIPEKGIVAAVWNDLTDGIFQALAFTPIITFLMVLLNDPYLVWKLNYYLFSHFHGLAYFIVGAIFLFFVVYLYFFALLTPIFALHKKGTWKSKKHQKSILIFSGVFVIIIMVIRITFGVFR